MACDDKIPAWMTCIIMEVRTHLTPSEERAMSPDSVHSIILLMFVSVWALIGQFTFIKQ